MTVRRFRQITGSAWHVTNASKQGGEVGHDDANHLGVAQQEERCAGGAEVAGAVPATQTPGCRKVAIRLVRDEETAGAEPASPICTTSRLETAAISHVASAEFDPLVVHHLAEVAEWQARTVQTGVSERTWRFKSSPRHGSFAVVAELADAHG